MKIVAAVSIAFVMLIGVTGCGSDDDVQVESRVKNAAPEASGVSDGPSEADCDLIDLFELLGNLDDLDDLDDLIDRIAAFDRIDLRDLIDLIDRLDRLDLGDLDDLIDLRDNLVDRFNDLIDRIDLLVDVRYDIRDLLSRCAAASESGADAPEGDDVDGG
jgi:hypothetical protein